MLLLIIFIALAVIIIALVKFDMATGAGAIVYHTPMTTSFG